MKNKFKIHLDFPKEGVSFLDISPILANKELRREMKKLLNDSIDSTFFSERVDKVVGIESRGFLFLNSIADERRCGVVLARKPGKLPGKVISVSYGTEYSKDSIEMQVGSISPGDNVIIHDDILATGGTALAVKELVERLGGTVIGFSFIGEIEFLEGRKLLGRNISSPIKF